MNNLNLLLLQTNSRVETGTDIIVEDIMTFPLQLVPYSKLIVVTCKLVPCFPIWSYPSILSVWILSVCLSIFLSVWLCVRLSALNNRPCGIHPSPLAHPSTRPPARPPPARSPSHQPSRPFATMPTPHPTVRCRILSALMSH